MPPSPDARLARLAARRHGVFTRTEALEAGLTPRMIQGRRELGLWVERQRGVYALSGAPRTWQQDLMAACLATGGSASHRSAAALHGLLPHRAPEVVVPRGSRRARRGVTVRETSDLQAGDRCTVDAIPTTTVTRTLADLAGVLDAEAFEEVLDRALTRELTSLGRLQRRADRLPPHGREGSTLLRAALAARRRAAPETRLERRLLRVLARGGFDNFETQVWVTVSGRRFRLDLADRHRRVAIEADEAHHAGLGQWRNDLQRQNLLVGAGWTILRFTEPDLADPPIVWARVEAVLARVGTA